MTDELESMKANLKKAQGFVQDVLSAANKLPAGEAADDFYTAVEEVSDGIDWALERLQVLADTDTDTSADGIVIPNDGGDE